MRIRWRGLELPSHLERDESVSTETYGRFIIEPFERGFGTTVGNSLRRILLSSLEGAAVYAVKIANASHEFSTMSGVYEDVADIILNIKQVVVAMEGEESRLLKISKTGPGDVTAADIVPEAGVEIMNPGHKLATLTEEVTFEAEMRVRTGRGYSTADENAGPEQEIGVIPIDAIFSPVTRVRYKTEDTRVGQRTNYDRLILEVWTRGSVSPEDALVEAAKILRKHLNPFVHYDELGDDVVAETPHVNVPSSEVDEQMQSLLNRSVSDLQLSVRANNCLESARISTVGELVRKTEAELLRVRSFGKTSLREVKRKLSDLGLSLGMTIGDEEGAAAAAAAAAAGHIPPPEMESHEEEESAEEPEDDAPRRDIGDSDVSVIIDSSGVDR